MESATGSVARPAGAPRERGWRSLVVALLLVLVVSSAPLWPATLGLAAATVRLLVPIEQPLLLVVPLLAACALVGWWAGGRLTFAVAWVALAAWMLAQPVPPQGGAFERLARGWALLFAAAFGLVGVLGTSRTFLVRALTALGLALATGVAVLVVRPEGAGRLGPVVTAELSRRVEASVAPWKAHTADESFRSAAARYPELEAGFGRYADRLRAVPTAIATLAPALLALESLLVAALVWGVFHRLSRVRIGAPLGSLRQFRFSDQLIWGLVVGLTIALLPSLAEWRAAGFNLLLFFGALYVTRGVGVLTWWVPGWGTVVVLVGLALLFPVVGAIALGLGLGDTWRDWRNTRARPTT